MGAPSLLTQSGFVMKPYLSTNALSRDGSASAFSSQGVFPVPERHGGGGGEMRVSCLLMQSECCMKPYLSTNALSIDQSDRRRGVVDSRLRSGFQLGLGLGNANDGSLRMERGRGVRCGAHAAGQGVGAGAYGYDLYQLLGIQKDAQGEEIKRAYRWLQKRCHPDVAGIKGHDMAILLNEAYAILSDPHRRASYDAAIVEQDEFAGYTGKPLYSRWYGRPGEDRAVFVEETRCIGCLKCALIAPDTFAIETRHGRARAVGQWLDDEGTIKDAIRACPVDCISWVKKDILPALEFIMSKQTRLPLGANNYSYVGVRRENVFQGADRFLQKYDKREEVQTVGFQETPAQREARLAAVQEINIKAGRWWWHDLMGLPNLTFSNLWDSEATRVSQGALVPITSTSSSRGNQFVDNNGPKKIPIDDDPDLGALFEAAKQRRRQGITGSSKELDNSEEEESEYWTPNEPISCPLPFSSAKRPSAKSESASDGDVFVGLWSRKVYNFRGNLQESLQHIMSAVPIAISVTAAVLVGMNGGGSDLSARSETNLNAGPLPTSLAAGPEMQLMLTAVVWYMIGSVCCEVAVFMTTAFVTFREKKRSQG